jgi:20S proteasome subunit beta 2
MGSGSLAAMAVFESGWKSGMMVSLLSFELKDAITRAFQREEAVQLVVAAISAGIFNDLGSGSNVDVCVITSEGTDVLRNFVKPNERYVYNLYTQHALTNVA